MKVFVQDERDMLNTDIFSTVVIQKVDDLEYDSLEDLSTLQKSLDEVKGNADIIDDENDSNDDDDSSFESSIVSFSVTNEAESLLCDPHYDTYFRLLDRTDSETAENQSNCSSETLRRRKVFVEDERNMLNTEIFLPYDAEEISELESLCHFEIERDENNIRKLLLVNTNLDEVKVDDDDNDDGIKDDGDNNDDSNNVENNTNNDDDDDEERSDDVNNDKEKEEEKKKIQDDDDDDDDDGKNDDGDNNDNINNAENKNNDDDDDNNDNHDDEADKDNDDGDINTNNEVGNPREITPTYYNSTDRCAICYNKFISQGSNRWKCEQNTLVK